MDSIFSQKILHVEIAQNERSQRSRQWIVERVSQYISQRVPAVDKLEILQNFTDDSELQANLQFIKLVSDDEVSNIQLANADIRYYVFKLDRNGGQSEDLDDDDSSVQAATQWILPNAELDGVWENLIYGDDIKTELLDYVETALAFSDHKIDPNVICWNRVVLLHGPPGTGKTSLCRALAHKLSIRLGSRFRYGQLLEVNSHSLFSKWFSESGKLVQKMFEHIQELADDPNALICILIDEVESLTAARNSDGKEPGDAMRVVNAVLTQIDAIKRNPNVIILTTSNITGSIDLAFVDRADIKKYIGLPPTEVVFNILQGCIKELSDKGLMRSNLASYNTLKLYEFAETNSTQCSLRLLEIAKKCQGLSGRSLRKLPFLAFPGFAKRRQMELGVYLDELDKAVVRLQKEKLELGGSRGKGMVNGNDKQMG